MTTFRSAAKVIKAFFIGYSTPGITRSTPQGYVPELTNHWLRFKIKRVTLVLTLDDNW